jgi:hypothetical protein
VKMLVSILAIADENAASHRDTENLPYAVSVGSLSPADSNVTRPGLEPR